MFWTFSGNYESFHPYKKPSTTTFSLSYLQRSLFTTSHNSPIDLDQYLAPFRRFSTATPDLNMPNELSETKPESSNLTMATRRAPLPLCYFPRVRNGSSTGKTLPSTSEFVDITSPVRIGSPSPLLPLPLFSYPVEPLTRETYSWPVLKEACLVVLARYNVHPKDFDLAHR